MSDARDAILARIRAALRDVEAPYDRGGGVETGVAPAAGDGSTDLFVERMTDYRATVTRVERAAEIAGAVAGALGRRGARRLAIPPGLPAAWVPGELELELVVDDPPLPNERLEAVDASLTACALAIAETGTLVLDASPSQGRRVLTLLPDVHICVVHPEQVVASVADAFGLLDPVRPITLVSGPSATSDIELERVEGVHGPRCLELIVAPA